MKTSELKYNLTLPKCFGTVDTLNLDVDGLYYFDNDKEAYGIQTRFTDKQISEMPIEIQKAIECGFLKKVEVDK